MQYIEWGIILIMMNEFDVDVFKELFEEKIKGLEGKIDSGNKLLGEKIETLNKNILKQNSRIGKLEEEDKRIEGKVDDAVTWAHHVVDTRSTDCPNLTRIKQTEEDIVTINKSLTLYNIIREYPKIALGALVVLVVGSIISGLSIVKTAITNDRQDEIIQQINELKYPEFFNPRGEAYDPFVKDSI